MNKQPITILCVLDKYIFLILGYGHIIMLHGFACDFLSTLWIQYWFSSILMQVLMRYVIFL